jgi:GT2 family glycosyltransferase
VAANRPADVAVLIPTCERAPALAVTLSGLAAQTVSGFRVVVSDQSAQPVRDDPLVAATSRLLRHRGCPIDVVTHLPRRGLAEQRAFLLSHATAPYVLFLDDDVWLAPQAIARLLEAMSRLRCGFVGMAVQGLSYADDVRPHEHSSYQEWTGGVRPERVRRDTPKWERWRLHNAANLVHLAERLRLGADEWRAYKVAWIGGCVLYDRAALLDCGGFDFWTGVPHVHAGEDMTVQLRVMERFGGAGLLPSLAYHLELPTTVPDRGAECYDYVIAADDSRR